MLGTKDIRGDFDGCGSEDVFGEDCCSCAGFLGDHKSEIIIFGVAGFHSCECTSSEKSFGVGSRGGNILLLGCGDGTFCWSRVGSDLDCCCEDSLDGHVFGGHGWMEMPICGG